MVEILQNLITVARILSAATIGAGMLMIIAHFASKMIYTRPAEWLLYEGLEFGYKGTISYTIIMIVEFAARTNGLI